MKTLLKTIISLSAIFIVVLLGFKISQKVQNNKTMSGNIKKLPSFSFLRTDGFPYSADNAKSPVVIVNYFDPDCDHCQYMTKQLVEHINSLSKAAIIMVTNADVAPVKNFIKDYQLERLGNVVVLRDTRQEFSKLFGPPVTPSFYIYRNGILSKSIRGETKIENIIAEVK